MSKALHFRDLTKNCNCRMKIRYLPVVYYTKVQFGDSNTRRDNYAEEP